MVAATLVSAKIYANYAFKLRNLQIAIPSSFCSRKFRIFCKFSNYKIDQWESSLSQIFMPVHPQYIKNWRSFDLRTSLFCRIAYLSVIFFYNRGSIIGFTDHGFGRFFSTDLGVFMIFCADFGFWVLLRTRIFDIFAQGSRIFSFFWHGFKHFWSKMANLAHTYHICTQNWWQWLDFALLKVIWTLFPP